MLYQIEKNVFEKELQNLAKGSLEVIRSSSKLFVHSFRVASLASSFVLGWFLSPVQLERAVAPDKFEILDNKKVNDFGASLSPPVF
ncbi:MAG: hypothetical protein ISR65_10905 [Bacteriovoracaceae bacterium]|nr:hypothetical protein [Bacteriovoracaceae bacterium]